MWCRNLLNSWTIEDMDGLGEITALFPLKLFMPNSKTLGIYSSLTLAEIIHD